MKKYFRISNFYLKYRNEQLKIWKARLKEATVADPDCFSYDPEEGTFDCLQE